jgi:hypothetical protein
MDDRRRLRWPDAGRILRSVAELFSMLGQSDTATVEAARRVAGLACNSIEASISRMLLERRHAGQARLKAAMAIDAALRRFAGRLSAMQLNPELARAFAPRVWRGWPDWIVTRMDALAVGNA